MGQPRSYARRQPETSALYRALAQHLESFIAGSEADETRAGLPGFVVRELRAFLDCGQLSRGFCRLKCSTCGNESLVAFACKRRGFCPSCCARRMSDLAAHLVDRVLPDVPVRQWVLSLPFPLRYPLAYDPDLCREVKGIFIRAVMGWTGRRAAAQGTRRSRGRTGAVVATQRFDSALRLSPHFHAIALDGVFTELGGGRTPTFSPIAPPTDEDMARLVRTVRHRVRTLLQKRGLLAESGELDSLHPEDPSVLDTCQAAAVQGRIAFGPSAGSHPARMRRCPETSLRPPSPLSAELDGFSLQAAVAFGSGQRPRLERLCRYLMRPPVAAERLSFTADGRIRYAFRRPWRDGSTAILFTPSTLIERLAALIPRPGVHLLTYHGILAPAASYRDLVVPQSDDNNDLADLNRCHTRRPRTSQDAPALAGRPTRRPRTLWADLLRRVFGLEVLRCRCGGRRTLLTFLTDPGVVAKILAHLGLDSDPHTRPPPELLGLAT